MDLKKTYIVDDEGKPKAVIIDYDQFRKIESVLLDEGLAKRMEEIENDDEVDLDEAKRLTGFLKKRKS
jgi:PHD/YefM family antitoxin component YafN of YafNO toxin-antitoxin module